MTSTANAKNIYIRDQLKYALEKNGCMVNQKIWSYTCDHNDVTL